MRAALVLFIVLGGGCVAWDVYETVQSNGWAHLVKK